MLNLLKSNRKTRTSSVAHFSRSKFTLYAFIMLYFLVGCNAQNNNKLLIERYLYSDAEVGTVMKLSSLGVEPVETVCSLQPYQDAVNYDHPERLRINEYLRKIYYTPSEAFWVLVMVTETTIELLKFARSKSADFGSFPMRNSLYPQPPGNFETSECVSYEQAALFKTQLEDRVYFMFGRTK